MSFISYIILRFWQLLIFFSLICCSNRLGNTMPGGWWIFFVKNFVLMLIERNALLQCGNRLCMKWIWKFVLMLGKHFTITIAQSLYIFLCFDGVYFCQSFLTKFYFSFIDIDGSPEIFVFNYFLLTLSDLDFSMSI